MSYLTQSRALSISISSLKTYSAQNPRLLQVERLKLQLKAEKQRDKAIYQNLKKIGSEPLT